MANIALVTGASMGIGRALSEGLLAQGFSVIGTNRSGNMPDVQHDNFQALALDLADPASIEAALKTLRDRGITIDLLINNAGIGPDLNAERPERNSFQKTFDVNVTGTVFFTEGMVDMMKQGGMIANISSKMGSVEVLQQSESVAYRMSKSALNMYTKILANRHGNDLRVAALHPGWVQTTIFPGNEALARLTPQVSAERILRFLNSDFETGAFWDAEAEQDLMW